MRKTVLSMLLGVALAASFVTATSANAADTCVDVTGAKACWHADGDYFLLTDTAADGHHTEVSWAIPGRQGICQNFTGKGSVKKCAYDFPEHQLLAYRVSVWEGNEFIRGSKQVNDCTSPEGGICA
ncbi:hypothetical protein ACGFU4_31255 [Streptomyces sp. NPDC048511]|uniref:hypothetical protein n=1 Tax=Streptomyces sp. NPDC048511 TaxID=3365562 RepID=UPI00371F7286